MLIRGNRAIIALIAVALLCGGAIEIWRRGQPPLASAGGAIVVHSPHLQQRDEWTYRAAGASGASGLAQTSRPIVASIGHASLIGLNLECDKDGTVTWRYTLPPQARLGMLRRTITPPTPPPPVQMPVVSPLHELARQGYLSPGATITGQVQAEDWPTVVINRQ
jgi:hypothetical protein